jgi:hypothetical protein
MKTLSTWGVVVWFAASAAAFGKAELAREEVTVTLAPPRAKVEGVYTFCNAGDEADKPKVYYPFPVGPGLGKPENISVRDGEGNDIPFSWGWREVTFEVTVPAGGETAVSVAYEQSCEGCDYKYILAGKREWGRPVGKATYVVEVPPQLAPLESSYKLEEVPAREGVVRYELRRDDFYPDVDLVLRWKRPDFYFGSTALDGGP